MNLRHWLGSLWSKDDPPSLEKQFSRAVDDHAARRGVPREQVLQALRQGLAFAEVGRADAPPAGDFPAYPEGDHLDPAELHQHVRVGALPAGREAHLGACPLCQEMVKHAQLAPQRVEQMALRLAQPPVAANAAEPANTLRRQRAELRREQQASFEEGLRGGTVSTPVARQEGPAPQRQPRAALLWASTAALIVVALVCYPQFMPEARDRVAAVWTSKAALREARSHLAITEETLESVRSLTQSGRVEVTTEGTISRVPVPSGDRQKKGYVLRVQKGGVQTEFGLVDEKGKFAGLPDAQGAKVTGQLLLDAGKPRIAVERVEIDQ